MDDLRAFIEVVDRCSFGLAAAALAVSQPTMSRRIKHLEIALGSPLLKRTTRRLAMTAFGRQVEPVARQILDQLDRALPTYAGDGAQRLAHLSIACIPSAAMYLLPDVLDRINSPTAGIRVRILDMTAIDGLECVARGEAELGINVLGASHPDILFTPLFEDTYVLATLRDHPLARKRRLTWNDLKGLRMIGVDRNNSNRIILDTALANRNLYQDILYESNHPATSLAMVERGLGATIIPKTAAPRNHDLLAIREIDSPRVNRIVGCVERLGGKLSPSGKKFKSALLERSAKR